MGLTGAHGQLEETHLLSGQGTPTGRWASKPLRQRPVEVLGTPAPFPETEKL